MRRPLNVVLQMHGPAGPHRTRAINFEHLFPANVPVEVLEQMKLVSWIPRNEHGAKRKANVRVIQEIVRVPGNACILDN